MTFWRVTSKGISQEAAGMKCVVDFDKYGEAERYLNEVNKRYGLYMYNRNGLKFHSCLDRYDEDDSSSTRRLESDT